MEPDIPEVSYRNPDKMKDGLRQCSKCKEYKSLDEFGVSRNYKAKTVYYRAECKPCVVKRGQAYREKNYTAVQLSKRNTHLKAAFGITLNQYNLILAEQGGMCAICGAKEANLKGRYKSLAVDHNRECCPTSKTCGQCIRGLLCNRCNRAIGLFADDPILLEKAIEYLSGWVK